MSVNITAAKLINIVSYKTDIQSLKKVKDDMKKLRQSSSGMFGSAMSPAVARASVRQATTTAQQQMRAIRTVQIKEFKKTNSGMVGEAKKGWAALAAEQTAAMSGGKIKLSSTTLSEKAKQAALKAQAASRGRDTRAGVRTSFFESEASRTRLDPSQVSGFRRQLSDLNNSYRGGTLSVSQYNESTRQLIQNMKRQSKEMLTIKERFKGIRAETVLIGLTAGVAIKSILDTGKDFQQMGLSFDTAFGKDKAKEMAFVTAEADRLGLNLIDVSKSYAKIAYGSKQLGFDEPTIRGGFTAVSEAAVAWGLTKEQVDGKHMCRHIQ